MRFLRALLDAVLPPRNTAQTVRHTTRDSLANHHAPYMVDEHITALLPYRQPAVHAAIIESKFHAETRAHMLLGTILAEYLRDSDHAAFSASLPILIPIPLSKQRMRERGHNQSARITQEAVHLLETTYSMQAHLLRRTRHTPPQTSLSRSARLSNMRQAFAAYIVDTEATYLLIDDVTTTGATLHAARDALIEAGAKEVHCIALAH